MRARAGRRRRGSQAVSTFLAMAIREVPDSKGREWKVWLTEPMSTLPRVIERRKVPREVDRRSWLVCDCESLRIRRRVFEFPEDWETMPDLALGNLCESGLPTTGPRRLIE